MKTAESHNASLTGFIQTATAVLPFEATPVVQQRGQRCSACGTEGAASAYFCTHCGRPFFVGSQPFESLQRVCSVCGTHLKQGDNYCSTCGYQVVNLP